MHGITESLAGRVSYVHLLPFSIGELEKGALLPQSPFEAMVMGGYPPLHTREVDRDDWFQSYLDTYIERDVGNFINPGNKRTFRKFITLCALRSGKQLVLSDLAKECEVSTPTISSWVSILSSSFIIYLLEPYSTNLGKRLTKSPKLYFLDTGLLCYLLGIHSWQELVVSPHLGHITETFAIIELIKKRYHDGRPEKLCFYRDKNGTEVDAIANWHKNLAIGVKSSTSPNYDAKKHLEKFVALDAQTTYEKQVFYLGERRYTLEGTSYLPWKEWGEEN